MIAHYAVRSLMHEAALKAHEDPDRLSFAHSVRVVRRKMTTSAAIPPRERKRFHERTLDEILQERVVSSRNRCNPRGVKRKMSNFPFGPESATPPPPSTFERRSRSLSEQYWV